MFCYISGSVAENKPDHEFKKRVKQLGSKLYRVGDVTVDAKLDAVVFPAKVNQLVGLIEYALVTEKGKIHESFLSTKVSPSDIHGALLLLGAKPGSLLSTVISWKNGDKWVRKPISRCIGQYPLEAASERDDKVTDNSFDLKSVYWKWTGSRRRSNNGLNALTADESGSILSLQPDFDALLLIEPMVETGRFGTHVWPERAPRLGEMVQVFIGKSKNLKP